MERYRDRTEAGRELATAFGDRDWVRPLVLAVPRGGVPVGAVVATALGGDLDVVVARKVGAPGNPELAIGAVGAEGDPYLDRGLMSRLGVTDEWVEREVARQVEEVRRREAAYRGDRPPPAVAGRAVVVVDDGVATGATLRAALVSVRAAGPAELWCGVPVGPPATIADLRAFADGVVCPRQPPYFMAVGEWYRDFRQVGDDEVRAILDEHRG